MFEHFTRQAREAVVDAQAAARSLGHDYVGTEHLLIALARDAESLAARTLSALGVSPEEAQARAVAVAAPGAAASDAEVLEAIGIDLDAVRRKAEEAFGRGALDRAKRSRGWGRRRLAPGHLRFTSEAKMSLELSLREALRLQHRWIGPEHLLLGLLRQRTGSGARALRSLGITLEEAEAAILDLLREAS